MVSEIQDQSVLSDDGPANLESEMYVIGSLLLDRAAFMLIADIVKDEFFYAQDYRLIFQACRELFEEEIPIDQEVVRQRLAAKEQLEQVGGDAILSAAVAAVPHSYNVRYHAHVVRQHYILRQIVNRSDRIREIGMDPANATDAAQALAQAESTILDIDVDLKSSDFVQLKDSTTIRRFLNPASVDPDEASEPVPTGFAPLDRVMGGLHPSDLIIVAARPAVGKSTLALNIALNAAKANDERVIGIFSLEMGIEQVIHRMAAAHAADQNSGVSIQNIRNGTLSELEQNRLNDAYGWMEHAKIFVDDTSFMTANAIMARARRLRQQRGRLDLIIVDYMQLLEGSSPGSDMNRTQAVSEISRRLKGVARDLNVPVVACSQLNRQVENRPSREPRLADLRESGAIEQDADVVMFIHREDKNVSEDEWNRRNPTQAYPLGLATIMIAKHRHGPTANLDLAVRDEFGLFYAPPEVESVNGQGYRAVEDLEF